ncbi:hypothetical protein CEXT_460321 [Caerostris extrusa]|uniref:HNH endonuclease n=1 Tax=Caerostris extrusa TaxID=172846 RepID=A0AAV4Y3J0_CAEEX|nr:hypothetical protein CEXT_460321 [Caerostris extrusa]
MKMKRQLKKQPRLDSLGSQILLQRAIVNLFNMRGKRQQCKLVKKNGRHVLVGDKKPAFVAGKERDVWIPNYVDMNHRNRTFNYIPFGTRNRGRSKLKWNDCVEADLNVLRVTNWKTVVKQRLEWKKVLWKALARHGL